MKFSWKIFISTFLLVLMALNVGEMVIVSILFDREMQAEVELAQYENLMMKSEIAALLTNYNNAAFRSEYDNLEIVLKTLSPNWIEEGKLFQILTEEGKVINQNIGNTDFLHINKAPTKEDYAFYKVFQQGDAYYLQMCSTLRMDDEIILIQNVKDVTKIFHERNRLHQKVFGIICFIGVICGVINWIIAQWLSKPIREMTNATRKIRDGNMDVKVHVKSNDELGSLGEHFNIMTSSLKKSITDLEDFARRQEEFAGNFAHELKTPLTSIIGYSDLLRSQKLDEETTFKAANYIYSEGQRLEKLSIKMLELIVERNAEIHKREIKIGSLIYETLEIFKSELEKKKIQLNINIEYFQVNVDVELMKTVFINLIDNARKAVEEGGSININAKKTEGQVSIRIEDNGRGIPEEDLKKITEAFYRVDKSRSRTEGGAGLGLSICTHILQLHSGSINFESKVGCGTCVNISWRDDFDEGKA